MEILYATNTDFRAEVCPIWIVESTGLFFRDDTGFAATVSAPLNCSLLTSTFWQFFNLFLNGIVPLILLLDFLPKQMHLFVFYRNPFNFFLRSIM